MTNRIPHPFYENAYLYKQPKSKFWTMDYRNADGKRARKSSKTSDKKEAIRILSENLMLIEKVKSGEITLTSQSKNTVSKVVSETIGHYDSLKPQKPVYVNYKRVLRQFAEKHGSTPIEKVNRQVLREYFSQGYTRAVLDNIKTALRTLFILCEDKGYIDRMPDFPRGIETKKPATRTSMGSEQIKEMIKRFYLKSLDKKFDGKRRVSTEIEVENARICCMALMLLYYLGVRIGELRYMKGEDFTSNKVKKEMRAYFDIKYSKTLPRKILIPLNVNATVKMLLKENGLKNTDYILKNRITGKIPQDFTKIIKRDINANPDFYEQNGIKDFVLYRLRHTFIIEKLSEGKNIYHLAKHCGTSVAVIEKNYANYIVASSYDNIYEFEEQTKLFNG